MARRGTLTLLLLLPVLVSTAGVAAAPAPVPASVTTFVVSGHGWGHGVGLAQYGALGYARSGSTHDRILAHYYPGTALGKAPVSRVRVLVSEGRRTLTIASARPFTLQTTGGTRTLPAGTYRVPSRGLRPPLVALPGQASLSLDGRLYRGSIRVTQAAGSLQAVNTVGLDAYLYGVIASEMSSDWPLEALKSQAVAARSYALASLRGGDYDLYADTRSQVYGGVAAETPSARASVDATRGQVLLHEGKIAQTFFYASSGGRTADVTDIWLGSKPVPYLVSVPDPYDTLSPYHDWGPVAITAAAAGRALGLPGLRGLTLRRAPSQRVREVVVGAAAGRTSVPGNVFRRALGLRSTWFRVGVLTLERPASPVAAGEEVELRGWVLGVVQPRLEQRASGGGWEPGGLVRPGRSGAFVTVARPLVSTDYRLRSGAVATEAVRVAVG